VPLRVTGGRWRQGCGGKPLLKQWPRVSPGRFATVTHGYVDPRLYRAPGRQAALGIGVVTAKGANILELGKDAPRRPMSS